MRFGELLSERTIDLDLAHQAKDEVIRSLVSRLADANLLPDAGKATTAVLERESALSTGVGQGVAVPHATLANITKPAVAFGRSADGISFGSMDGKPVTLVFLLIAPEEEISLHLKLLSRISRLCNNPDLRKALHEASDPAAVLDVIRDYESPYQEL